MNIAPATRLVGGTALVTGAAGGMGAAIVNALVEAGATKVYGWDRVEARGEHVEGAIVDLADSVAVEAALNELDVVPQIVVNAAGVYQWRDTFDVPTEQFIHTLNVNLVAPYIIQRVVARRLRDENLEGAFINISSIAGKRAFGNQVDYVASKAGLIGLTRSAAMDLAPGITVNAIAPGTVRTNMIEQVVTDLSRVTGLGHEEQTQALIGQIPTGRMQEPWEIAAAVVFLASNAARSITGETLNVDGGSTRD